MVLGTCNNASIRHVQTKRFRIFYSSAARRLNMEEKPDMKSHVGWPAAFAIGLVFASVFALNENKFPPMMVALVASVPFAPLLAKLTNSEISKNTHLVLELYVYQWLDFGHLGRIIST